MIIIQWKLRRCAFGALNRQPPGLRGVKRPKVCLFLSLVPVRWVGSLIRKVALMQFSSACGR